MPSSTILAKRRRGLLVLASLLILAFFASASAYDGFTVGLFGGPPTGGSYVLNAHLVQPVLGAELNGTPLQFAARADLTSNLTFRSMPSAGLALVTSAVDDGSERYLGVGAGASSMLGGLLWSVYALAGVRTPLAGGLYGGLEVQLVSNRLITAPKVGLSLEYTFGGK